jgi:hypothetical protein
MWKVFFIVFISGSPLCPQLYKKIEAHYKTIVSPSLLNLLRPIPLDLPSPSNHDAAEQNKEKR